MTDFSGFAIWTDGENIYYSNGSEQYVLDKSTSTWQAKTWNGLTSFQGINVWTDGENIYYSNGSEQYVLDKSTSTWQAKTWNGLTSFQGNNIWTDGENIYYSFTSNQYVLDKATSTWTEKTWRLGQRGNYDKLYDLLKGNNVWTDGENIYYNYEDIAIGAYSYALINPLKKTPQIGEKYGAVKPIESGKTYTHNIVIDCGNNGFVTAQVLSTGSTAFATVADFIAFLSKGGLKVNAKTPLSASGFYIQNAGSVDVTYQIVGVGQYGNRTTGIGIYYFRTDVSVGRSGYQIIMTTNIDSFTDRVAEV